MHEIHHFTLYLFLFYIHQYHFIKGTLNEHGISTCHPHLTCTDECTLARATAGCGRSWIERGNKETIYHFTITPFYTDVLNREAFSHQVKCSIEERCCRCDFPACEGSRGRAILHIVQLE